MKGTFTKIGDTISRALSRERVCEACGSEFSCGAGLRGCWCSEIEVSDSARAELQTIYRDCLCRACLEQVSVKAQSGDPK